MIFNNDLLDKLLYKASENERLRFSKDLRDSTLDQSQRMLNAIQPSSIIDIHRHKDTSETVILLRGAVTEVFYDDNVNECARYDLSICSGNIGLHIPAGMWHTLIPIEPSVIIEVKNGSYKPLSSDDILKK